MMGFDDIIVSFAVSVGAGVITDLVNEIKGNKNVESRMNKCFNNALDRWEVSQETRIALNGQSLKYYTDLIGLLSDSSKGVHPKTKELLHLWVKEMQNDDVCSKYIIMHKQDLANRKLDKVFYELKNELLNTISNVADKQDEILNRQDNMTYMMESLMSEILSLKQNISIENAPNLIVLLQGSIAEMIENLKMHSARKIIEEIEQQFSPLIKSCRELKAEIKFRKGQALLFSQPSTAMEMLHEAYTINPDAETYKSWEIRRLLVEKRYLEAKKLSEELKDTKYLSIIDVVKSADYVSVFASIPDIIKNDMGVRQIILECLVNNKDTNCAFLFENIDLNVVIPNVLTLSTINQWMFLLSNCRNQCGDAIVLSFDAPQIEVIKPFKGLINKFWDKLSSTEIKDCFPLISCLHSYWNFLCTQNQSWSDEFFKIDRSLWGEQKPVFCLIEISIYILLGKYEEAFTSIVAASQNIDTNIIRVSIALFGLTGNIQYLNWIFDKMKACEVKVDDTIATLIAHSMHQGNAVKIKVQLDNVKFEKESTKDLLLQLSNFNSKGTICLVQIKENVDKFNDELKAYAANLLAATGNTDWAFEMLRPIVNEDIPDVKQQIFLRILSQMQEKAPELYRILIKNRHAGNYCGDQLLRKEYQLDSQIADFENAFEAISILHERHPDDTEIFAHMIFTMGHICPESLSKYENEALRMNFSDPMQATLAYRAFSENGYLETAAELLYNSAKVSEDYGLRTFYHNETLCGLICSIARQEYEVAEEGNYVLCDIDNKRLFYVASVNGSDVSKALLGVKKGDIVSTEIAFKQTQLTVIGIHNKYYKLAGDILNEAMNGGNPNLVPFDIDMKHPLESLENIIKKMSKDNQTPEEKRNIAYAKYEQGELALLQLVDDNNMLAGYYKFLFTPFNIYVNISVSERAKLAEIPTDASFILDLPTIITFAEFTSNTSIQLNGPKAVTKLLHEYLKFANKSTVRITDGDFFDAMSNGKLVKYSEYVDVDAKEHIRRLLEWTEENCTDILTDQALGILQQGNNTPLKDQFFSSLSLLLNEKFYFVTDDIKISSMLPMANIITTETYVKLFNNTHTSKKYSEFLFEHGFLGIELDERFISNEYKKMKYGQNNSMVAIMQNMYRNPYQLSVAITSCMNLAQKEFDINTLKLTFTNMFAMALKGFVVEYRQTIVNYILQSMNAKVSFLQITKQCLIDALIIANS